MTKRNILVGNWKMNQNLSQCNKWIEEFNTWNITNPNVLIGLAPPSVYIQHLLKKTTNNLLLGAQNCSEHNNGAYTGEISAEILKSLSTNFCIVGHSERRLLYQEQDTIIAQKVVALQKQSILPIICLGETLEERENKRHFKVIEKQLSTILTNIDLNSKIVLAYEPIWAIGTGITASKNQAQEIHHFIREQLASLNNTLAQETAIIYGGSCNSSNANELFSAPDIDGALVGGASLNANDFYAIYKAFSK